MKNILSYKYYMPIILFMLMLVDGHVSSAMMGAFDVPMTFTSHLMFLVMMFSIYKVDKTYILILSTIMGLLYDSYFYNVLGINLILLPVLMMLLYTLFDYVEPGYLTFVLTFIIFVTFISMGRAILLATFGLTSVGFLDFFTRNLAPTLMLNVVYIVALVFPLSKFYDVYKK